MNKKIKNYCNTLVFPDFMKSRSQYFVIFWELIAVFIEFNLLICRLWFACTQRIMLNYGTLKHQLQHSGKSGRISHGSVFCFFLTSSFIYIYNYSLTFYANVSFRVPKEIWFIPKRFEVGHIHLEQQMRWK